MPEHANNIAHEQQRKAICVAFRFWKISTSANKIKDEAKIKKQATVVDIVAFFFDKFTAMRLPFGLGALFYNQQQRGEK